ncbi:MAG: hypothetical protein JNL25_01990 [Rhodospirillaceae bacterium]|nr:hypothetical protein [Rhodospirillaceae bacterium]
MAIKPLGLALSLPLILPLLAACQPQAGRVDLQSDEKLVLSQGTWDYFQEYLQTIGGGKRGAFVVSDDGYFATYFYCPVTSGCYSNINYSADALKACTSEGYQCVLFAKNDDIVVEYEVAD